MAGDLLVLPHNWKIYHLELCQNDTVNATLIIFIIMQYFSIERVHLVLKFLSFLNDPFHLISLSCYTYVCIAVALSRSYSSWIETKE